MTEWTTDALATVVAACIAAGSATAAAVVSGINASRIRRFARREQWWARFSWAMERAISAEQRENELGLSVLNALIEVPWVTSEDSRMAVVIVDSLSSGKAGDQ